MICPRGRAWVHACMHARAVTNRVHARHHACPRGRHIWCQLLQGRSQSVDLTVDLLGPSPGCRPLLTSFLSSRNPFQRGAFSASWRAPLALFSFPFGSTFLVAPRTFRFSALVAFRDAQCGANMGRRRASKRQLDELARSNAPPTGSRRKATASWLQHALHLIALSCAVA